VGVTTTPLEGQQTHTHARISGAVITEVPAVERPETMITAAY
jgi:hypothetical protein